MENDSCGCIRREMEEMEMEGEEGLDSGGDDVDRVEAASQIASTESEDKEYNTIVRLSAK